jgi:betaine lipid synthase
MSTLSALFPQAASWEHLLILLAASSVLLLVASVFGLSFMRPKLLDEVLETPRSYITFFYVSFLKPHTGDDRAAGQQGALESFYQAQV